MKKLKFYVASALLMVAAVTVQAQNTPVSQMNKLDRGLIALSNSSGGGKFVSWRFLGTDDPARTTLFLSHRMD